jgi:hypothetical protein
MTDDPIPIAVKSEYDGETDDSTPIVTPVIAPLPNTVVVTTLKNSDVVLGTPDFQNVLEMLHT